MRVTTPSTGKAHLLADIRSGDIWLAQLDPTLGSEIQKSQP